MKKAFIPMVIMAIAITCYKVDAMCRAEREKEEKIQDSILAPTRCILDSVTFHSREAADRFVETLPEAKSFYHYYVARGKKKKHLKGSRLVRQLDSVEYKGHIYVPSGIFRKGYERIR